MSHKPSLFCCFAEPHLRAATCFVVLPSILNICSFHLFMSCLNNAHPVFSLIIFGHCFKGHILLQEIPACRCTWMENCLPASFTHASSLSSKRNEVKWQHCPVVITDLWNFIFTLSHSFPIFNHKYWCEAQKNFAIHTLTTSRYSMVRVQLSRENDADAPC